MRSFHAGAWVIVFAAGVFLAPAAYAESSASESAGPALVQAARQMPKLPPVPNPKAKRRALYTGEDGQSVPTLIEDANRDGIPDSWTADADGDGKIDVRGFDRDGDGVPEAWDTDDDGVVDYWQWDTDADARIDAEGYDSDNDGLPNQFFYDDDRDGRFEIGESQGFDQDHDGTCDVWVR